MKEKASFPEKKITIGSKLSNNSGIHHILFHFRTLIGGSSKTSLLLPFENIFKVNYAFPS